MTPGERGTLAVAGCAVLVWCLLCGVLVWTWLF